jgi:hypothetical protein
MASNWNRITKLLPSPESPKGLARPWKSVEQELGVALPSDYKKFIDHYGTGGIFPAEGHFTSLIVWNLRGVSDVVSWVSSATRRYQADREAGNEIPFASYPDPNGLLAFGATPDGDFLNWRMKGSPGSWEIVYYHCSAARMILLKHYNFTRMLLGLLRQDSPLMPYPISYERFAPPCHFGDENW